MVKTQWGSFPVTDICLFRKQGVRDPYFNCLCTVLWRWNLDAEGKKGHWKGYLNFSELGKYLGFRGCSTQHTPPQSLNLISWWPKDRYQHLSSLQWSPSPSSKLKYGSDSHETLIYYLLKEKESVWLSFNFLLFPPLLINLQWRRTQSRGQGNIYQETSVTL